MAHHALLLLFFFIYLAIFTWKDFQTRTVFFNPLIHTHTSLKSYWVKNQALLVSTELWDITATCKAVLPAAQPTASQHSFRQQPQHEKVPILICHHCSSCSPSLLHPPRKHTHTQVTRFSLSTKLLSFPLGNSSGTLDVGCAVSQPNLPVWTLPKHTKTFTTSFELEWTQTKATRVLSPGQLCPSALVQQGRKQARGSSLASGVLGENSLASKFFSVKNNFFAFQLEQRRKENWPIYLRLCFLFFF